LNCWFDAVGDKPSHLQINIGSILKNGISGKIEGLESSYVKKTN
jgi:hypothetical protein